MRIKILLFSFLMIFTFSCSNQDNVEKIIYEDLKKIIYEGEELWLKNFFNSEGSLSGQQTFKEVFPDSFVPHGFSKYFYPSGSVEYFTRLDNGNKIGNVSKYYESGQIKEVWFYNPVGQAMYSAHFNEDGEIIKELAPDQKFPQVIYKHLENDSVELKVYSVDFPNRKKNVYLIDENLEIIDSTHNSNEFYNKFVIYLKYQYYQINVDYYDINSGSYIETDNLQFAIEE